MKFVRAYNTNRKIYVDNWNYDLIRHINWHDDGKRIMACINGKAVRLARLIKNIKDPNYVVDHIDGNHYNNLDGNLRVCTKAENNRNRRSNAFKNNASEFLGTSWEERRKKWEACITVDKRKIHLGYFGSEVEAAKAYDAAAIHYHKEFARLNFPVCQPSLVTGTSKG